MNDFTVSTQTVAGTKALQRQRVSTKAKVRPPRRSLLLPGLVCLLVMSVLFYVWTRVQVVQFGYEISLALREKEEVIIAHHELTLEVATLRSAQQVEKRARERLGMDHPRKDQLVIIR